MNVKPIQRPIVITPTVGTSQPKYFENAPISVTCPVKTRSGMASSRRVADSWCTSRVWGVYTQRSPRSTMRSASSTSPPETRMRSS